jgi:hypothetical protein
MDHASSTLQESMYHSFLRGRLAGLFDDQLLEVGQGLGVANALDGVLSEAASGSEAGAVAQGPKGKVDGL